MSQFRSYGKQMLPQMLPLFCFSVDACLACLAMFLPRCVCKCVSVANVANVATVADVATATNVCVCVADVCLSLMLAQDLLHFQPPSFRHVCRHVCLEEKLSKQEAHTSNVMDRKCFSEEIRLEGTFKVYCEDRGFGFVTPDEGGEDVFVHLKDNPVLPDAQVGDTVTFNKTWDNRKNKCKGCNMVIAGEVLRPAPSVSTTEKPETAMFEGRDPWTQAARDGTWSAPTGERMQQRHQTEGTLEMKPLPKSMPATALGGSMLRQSLQSLPPTALISGSGSRTGETAARLQRAQDDTSPSRSRRRRSPVRRAFQAVQACSETTAGAGRHERNRSRSPVPQACLAFAWPREERKCKSCSYAVTDICPDHCCKRCKLIAGTHGSRCKRKAPGGLPEAHVNQAKVRREARAVAQPGAPQELRGEPGLGLRLGPRRVAGTSAKAAPPKPPLPKVERPTSPPLGVWAELGVEAPRGEDRWKAHRVTTGRSSVHPEDVASMPGWKRLQRHIEEEHQHPIEQEHKKKKAKAPQAAAAAKFAVGDHVEITGLQEMPRLNGRRAVVSGAPDTAGSVTIRLDGSEGPVKVEPTNLNAVAAPSGTSAPSAPRSSSKWDMGGATDGARGWGPSPELLQRRSPSSDRWGKRSVFVITNMAERARSVLAPAPLGPKQAAAAPNWPLLRLEAKGRSLAKPPPTLLRYGRPVVLGEAKAKATLSSKPTVQMGLEQPQHLARPAEERSFAPPPPIMIPPLLRAVDEPMTDPGKLLPKAMPPIA